MRDYRYTLRVAASYSLVLDRERSVDLNFDPTRRFDLTDDGRPVFVNATSIVPGSGSIASRDARVSPLFNRVSESRSDLRSRTAQLSVALTPVIVGTPRFTWSASYSLTHVREQVSGFTSTAASPLEVVWSRGSQGPHQFRYTLRYNFLDAVRIVWDGALVSGAAYTPMVAGDVNGDGYGNDRAFVPTPGDAASSQLAEGMRQLLEGAPAATRACLEKQLGTVARHNSCRGPWTSSASLNLELDRAKFRLPPRSAVTLSVSNPLAAADLMINGSGNLRGWGQSRTPDRSLLFVRGFDAAAMQFRYEVNQRFGAIRPEVLTLRSPVAVTIAVRVDLGRSQQRQQLSTQLAAGRTLAGNRFDYGALRGQHAFGVLNPFAMLSQTIDALQLTRLQLDSLATLGRAFQIEALRLWGPPARALADLPDTFDEREAFALHQAGRDAHIDLLRQYGFALKELLTPAQRRRLPLGVSRLLDPRYLESIRYGTGTYLAQ